MGFTEEEWALLYSSQRALHWEVMLENSRILASLAGEGQENLAWQGPGATPLGKTRHPIKDEKLHNQWKPERFEKTESNDRGEESSPSSPPELGGFLSQEDEKEKCLGYGEIRMDKSGLSQGSKTHPEDCREPGTNFSQTCPRGFPREKNATNAGSAGRASASAATCFPTGGSTPGRSPTSAGSAGRASGSALPLPVTRSSTPKKSRTNARSVGRTSAMPAL